MAQPFMLYLTSKSKSKLIDLFSITLIHYPETIELQLRPNWGNAIDSFLWSYLFLLLAQCTKMRLLDGLCLWVLEEYWHVLCPSGRLLHETKLSVWAHYSRPGWLVGVSTPEFSVRDLGQLWHSGAWPAVPALCPAAVPGPAHLASHSPEILLNTRQKI